MIDPEKISDIAAAAVALHKALTAHGADSIQANAWVAGAMLGITMAVLDPAYDPDTTESDFMAAQQDWPSEDQVMAKQAQLAREQLIQADAESELIGTAIETAPFQLLR